MEELLQEANKEILELKKVISDYEDIVTEKEVEINELKSTLEGVRELSEQIQRII